MKLQLRYQVDLRDHLSREAVDIWLEVRCALYVPSLPAFARRRPAATA